MHVWRQAASEDSLIRVARDAFFNALQPCFWLAVVVRPCIDNHIWEFSVVWAVTPIFQSSAQVGVLPSLFRTEVQHSLGLYYVPPK